jgi:hypothetical protein
MSNPNAPLTSPKYPAALPPENLGFSRAGADPALPPANLGLSRAGADPALPPGNIGMDRDPPLSLTPGNIGMDRAPNEALSEIFGSYQPPIDPTQEYYEDPIIKLGMEDLRKGDLTKSQRGEHPEFINMANLSQTWGDINTRLGPDAANEWLASEQGKKQANLGNYDLLHLMGNGYTREEAQEILNEQGIAPTGATYGSRGGIMNLKR